jgi:hypothetical protein
MEFVYHHFVHLEILVFAIFHHARPGHPAGLARIISVVQCGQCVANTRQSTLHRRRARFGGTHVQHKGGFARVRVRAVVAYIVVIAVAYNVVAVAVAVAVVTVYVILYHGIGIVIFIYIILLLVGGGGKSRSHNMRHNIAIQFVIIIIVIVRVGLILTLFGPPPRGKTATCIIAIVK